MQTDSWHRPPQPVDPLDRSRFPHRPVAVGRARLREARPRGHGDAVLRLERLPGPARQRRGGPRHAHPRQLRQRLPRDLDDPARRGGLRPGPGGADDRQRPGPEDDQALCRRRAAAVVGRRPRVLRAHPGHASGTAEPGPDLAHQLGKARADLQHPDDQPRRAAPGGHDLRGRDARWGCLAGHLQLDPQPAGRLGRVQRQLRGNGRGPRPAAGRVVRAQGAAAPSARDRRRPAAAGLPVHQLQDDDRHPRPPRDRDRQCVDPAAQRRGGPGQAGLRDRRRERPAGTGGEARRRAHLQRRAAT